MQCVRISYLLMILTMLWAPLAVFGATPAPPAPTKPVAPTSTMPSAPGSPPPGATPAATTPPTTGTPAATATPSTPAATAGTTTKPDAATPASKPTTTPATATKAPDAVPVKKADSDPTPSQGELDVPLDVEGSSAVCSCTNDDLKNCREGVGDYLCIPYYGKHCQTEIKACIKSFRAPQESLSQVCDCYKVLEQCGDMCNAPATMNTCSAANAKPTLDPKACVDYAISPCAVPTPDNGPSDRLCAACCSSAQNFNQFDATPPYWSCLANPLYNKTRHSFDSCIRSPIPLQAPQE